MWYIRFMNKYISFDTETGGLEHNTSLLTAYFAVLDENFKITAELDLALKPNDGIYLVKGQGLGVNLINLVEHDKIAITYKEASSILYDFLQINKTHEYLIPIGQNVAFDAQRILTTLVSLGSWERFVSHRVIDIGCNTRFLQLLGLISPTQKTGLHDMRDYFEIRIDGQDHSAKADVLIGLEVLKCQIQACKGLLNLVNY